jgi:hypothetical protein
VAGGSHADQAGGDCFGNGVEVPNQSPQFDVWLQYLGPNLKTLRDGWGCFETGRCVVPAELLVGDGAARAMASG